MKTAIMTATACAGLLALGSCSLFNKQYTAGNYDTPATATTATETPATTPAPAEPERTIPVTITTPAPVIVAGTEETAPEAPAEETAAKAADAATAQATELAGEWVIVKVGDKAIERDEDMPFLHFVPSEGRFYGSNGCNVLNGYYAVKDRDMTFSEVLTTMRYCPDVDFDRAINSVVRDGNTVDIMVKKIGNETYLYFNNHTGKSLMTLRRHNMQFLDGKWFVNTVNGKAVDDEEANVFFDINSLKIHGNTGCNYFNGTILIDPSVANSISFSGMGVTRMSCPNLDRERMILVALEETATAVEGNDSTVILLNRDNKPLMTLKKAPDTVKE